MSDITLLTINASPKPNSTTQSMLNKFISSANDVNIQCQTIDLYKEQIPFINGKLGENAQALLPIHEKLIKSDGFVIATPTYWFNVPAILKNLLDNLAILEDNGFLLEGKVAGFIVYSPEGGEYGALAAMALPLNHMGVVLPPYCMIFYRSEHDSWVEEDITKLSRRMKEQIVAQKKLQMKWDWT